MTTAAGVVITPEALSLVDDVAMNADQWTIRGRTLGLGAVSATVATAAGRAVQQVAGDGGRGAIGEPASDLRDLRADPQWSLARQAAVASARQVATQALLDALGAGLADRLSKDAPGLGLVYAPSPQDSADLPDMPIVSHTAAEHAADLAQALDFALAGAVVPPLLRPDPPGALVERVIAAGDTFAVRLGQLSGDAYQAGRSLALAQLRAALVTP